MGGGRDLGIDLTWCLALIGLAGWAQRELPPETLAAWVLEGPPVMLATVLAGAGAALAVRRRLDDRDSGGVLRATIVRGLLLAAFGLVLGTAAFEQWGFLVPLGLALAVAAGALLLPGWAVAALAVVVALIGSLFVAESVWVMERLDAVPSLTTLVTDPGTTWTDVMLAGRYPVATLLPGVLAGFLVERLLARGSRADTARTAAERVRLGLLALAGALLAAAGIGAHLLVTAWVYGQLDPLLSPATNMWMWATWQALVPLSVEDQIIFAPGTGSAPELARTIGLALVAIGVVSLLASLVRGRGRLWAGLPRSIGKAAISLYALAAVAATVAANAPQSWFEGVQGVLLYLAPWAVVLVILLTTLSHRRASLESLIDELAERAAGGRQPLRLRAEVLDDLSFQHEVRLRAPIERVWRAMTDPDELLQWTESPDYPVLHTEVEPGPGGAIRQRGATLFGSRTVVIEFPQLEAPSTMVSTIRAEDGPVVMTSVDRLFEFDGVTTIRTRHSYATTQLRDQALRMLGLQTLAHRRLADLVERPAAASGTMVG